MLRALTLLLAVFAAVWLQFEFFPGHTYLHSSSQLYLPMLERLNAPGFLSRDLVATHPTLAHSIYDEITLSLHDATRLDFKDVLLSQQLLFRFCAILGVFLLAKSCGLRDALSLVAAILVNLGATLAGPAVSVVEPEPVPYAFSAALILLAVGLLAREKPLLSGLAGGFALLYDPAISAPFCGAIVVGLLNRKLRPVFRPALTVLIIFGLLLANLAQLQPGIGESSNLFSRISEPFAELQRYRIPSAWISEWPRGEVWNYIAIWIGGLWATVKIWNRLNRQTRFFLLIIPLFGVLSAPITALLLEKAHWEVIPQIEPTHALLFTVALASFSAGVAGICAAKEKKTIQSIAWLLLPMSLPITTRPLDLFRLNNTTHVIQFGLTLLLAGGIAATVRFTGTYDVKLRPRSPAHFLPLCVSIATIFVMFILQERNASPPVVTKPVEQLAEWAETTTWGSSMFLFPDAGRSLYPGVFRAESLRALWVDWKSGDMVSYSEPFAGEWWERWQQTMDGNYSPQRLESISTLPIDYYVLRREHRLVGVRPVFMNREFVVYDALDLRNVIGPLKQAGKAKF